MGVDDEPSAHGEVFDFAREFEKVAGPLRRYARKLTQNDAACDDLVQDTLLRAWAARDRFVAGTNLKAWLFRIARNRFLSVRQRSKRQVLLDADEINRLLTTPPSQEYAIHLRDIDRALAKLSPAQATALRMIQDGCDPDVAARLIGISNGTLRQRMSRGRKAVKAFFDQPVSMNTHLTDFAKEDIEKALAVPQPEVRNFYKEWKASGSRKIG